jgi:hypothetical protein
MHSKKQMLMVTLMPLRMAKKESIQKAASLELMPVLTIQM